MTQAKFPVMLDEERAKYVTREIKYEQEIKSLRQQLAAAVAACKVKDEALRDCAFDESGYCINPDAEEALAVMPSISEWKTRWQKENDELRQQLAATKEN